jgi:rod shape-determining protein MreD
LSIILAFPILLAAVMLQSVVISRLPLLSGSADLVLLVIVAWSLQKKVRYAWFWTLLGGLMVSYVSAMPVFAPLIGYVVVFGFTRLLQRRIWQVPILTMITATLLGTFFTHILNIAVLFITGDPIPFQESITFITLPSALLNLLLALPVFVLITDLAKWVYPEEVEV